MAVLCAMQSACPFNGSAGHVEASSVAVVTVALWAILVKLSLRGSLGHVSGSMVVISCLHFICSGFCLAISVRPLGVKQQLAVTARTNI